MATLAGISLGIVKSESRAKDSNLFQQPMPKRDSDKAILADLFGSSKTIGIQGLIVGTEQEQNNFIDAIDGLQNGNQSSSVLVSDFRNKNINVLIQSFDWQKNEADLTRLSYNLMLIEGTAI